MSRVLAAALERLLQSTETTPSSAFTAAQRRMLEDLGRRTGALRTERSGGGVVYRIQHREVLAAHLKQVRPVSGGDIDPALPLRAANIARTRDSKGGRHAHENYYLLTKAISDGVSWHDADNGLQIDLTELTRTAGAGVLPITDNSGWRSDGDLWLVENQQLFDRLDWMPKQASGTLAYYSGQIPGRLLNWLMKAPRVPRVILFPDYDGVGLMNYARLSTVCASPCEFWLMPGWESLLKAYGNSEVWDNTHGDFMAAMEKLGKIGINEDVRHLCRVLSREGLALEHEAVWLASSTD